MRKIVLATAAAAFILTGCANMDESQRAKATGTGIGAVAGAAVGGLIGGGRGAAIGAGIGGVGGYVWSSHMENQKRQMEQATQGTGVTVSQTADNQLKLDIPSDVSFDVNRANIKSNFAPILDRFAEGLRTNPNTTVRIIGHTDSSGSDAINNPLSLERATSTRDYLVARGVSINRIAVDGVGSRQPVASNDTAAGRAQNRRVEIYTGEAARQ
ncbi:MAG: putative lipoprotein YiaD [Paracidovorax wautersii]|uniref:Putative lipoprotein YiaD n=1 Tax=Paracidovorax wautersii TaxID=1177982 RepID=A0A7V8FNQ1_9BURK|nr:MAG: putative lipoprotein YiaD [Paracidovorax wautersii]